MQVKCNRCRMTFEAAETGYRRCPYCDSEFVTELAPTRKPESLAPQVVVEVMPTPWEQRRQVGLFAGLRDTVVSLARNPLAFFEHMEADSDQGITAYFVLVMLIPYTIAVLVTRWAASPQGLDGTVGRFQKLANAPDFMKLIANQLHYYFTGPGFAAVLVGSVIGRVILVVVWAAGAQAFLTYFKFPQRGWPATLKVFAYASTAGLLNFVPFVGPDLALMGLAVLAVIGISRVHHADMAQSIGAVLVPALIPGLGFCCFSTWWGAVWSVAEARPPPL